MTHHLFQPLIDAIQKATEILGAPFNNEEKTLAEEATEIIYGDREKTHGEPGRNLETIASMWAAITGTDITPAMVCQMMIALKLARSINDASHRDHWLDIVGYALLAERCGYLQQHKQEGVE